MAPGALDTTTGTKGTGSPAVAGPGATAGPPGSRAPLAVASATRRRVGRSSWTTPRLVRALTAACLVCVLGLGGAVASVLAGARDGIDAIGHRAAPQAVRAADL